MEQGKLDMHVQPLGLEGGEAIRDGEQPFPCGSQMIEALLEAEIAEVVVETSLRRNVENFSYCLTKALRA